LELYENEGYEIAAAWKRSTIVYAIVTSKEPFDPVKKAF
jgi:hypothetical protein